MSVFAQNNEKLEFSELSRLTESQLKMQIGHMRCERNDFGILKVQNQSQEWRRRLVEANILRPKPSGTAATLNFLYVRPGEETSDITTMLTFETLMDIFGIFGVEQAYFDPLCKGADIWHSMRRNNGNYSFVLVIQSLYSMICSFSSELQETTLILFGQHPEEMGPPAAKLSETKFNFYEREWFEPNVDLKRVFSHVHTFQRLQPHHLHHPLTFAYLGLIDHLFAMEIRSDDQTKYMKDIGDSEDESSGDQKKDQDSILKHGKDATMAQRMRISEAAKERMVDMSKLFRGVGMAEMVLGTLDEKASLPTSQGLFPGSMATYDKQIVDQYNLAAAWLGEAIPSARQKLKSLELQLRSRQERIAAITQLVSYFGLVISIIFHPPHFYGMDLNLIQ